MKAFFNLISCFKLCSCTFVVILLQQHSPIFCLSTCIAFLQFRFVSLFSNKISKIFFSLTVHAGIFLPRLYGQELELIKALKVLNAYTSMPLG